MRAGFLLAGAFVAIQGDWQTIQYGDWASQGTFNGAPFEQRFRFTRIYVRQGSSWRAVHAQNTTLQENNQ